MTIQPSGGGAIALAGEDRMGALDELREFLRSSSGDDDAVLTAALESALAVGEAFLGTALIVREFRDVLNADPYWNALTTRPVMAITGVTGLPAEGVEFTLPAAAYGVDIDADGAGWVRVTNSGAAGRVAIVYGAGLAANWSGIAQPIRQGAVMLAAHLSEGRGAETIPPASVTALWRPFRRMTLRGAVRR